MPFRTGLPLLAALLALPRPAAAQAAAPPSVVAEACGVGDLAKLRRNPTAAQLRCRYGARGPGRFGLLSYLDVPVYRPATPLPGTHVVGVPGMPRPAPGESYEGWEWRILRTVYGADVRRVHNDLAQLDPVFMSMIRRFERELARRGVRAYRRETYRTAQRQAWLFQQGRSRPGPFATTTLTSWHNRVDRLGRPAARAADYDVAGGQLARFHEIAAEIGLHGYGADSNDPGHVYLPDTDAATGLELAVLRLLPRVMHVTLATGRPEGEGQLPGATERWRRRTQQFIAGPPPEHPREPERAPGPPAVRQPARPRPAPAAAATPGGNE
ncbi:MAG TPA: hypothetical protein VFQ45_19780 [Longimicrobium sp.]|nr:hypothetical protein [Longimicrobium sp.]